MATQTTNYNLVKPALTDSPPDITVMNPNWDKIDSELKINSSAIGQITIQKDETKTTNFNPDGSITEVTKVGSTTVRTKTTTFPSATQIIEATVENGITTTKTTTFNVDGTIKEEVV